MQTPASRNAPCPCGSGRRYKECHGAIAPAATLPDEPQLRLMRGLAAQQVGRLGEAVLDYEAVLATVPRHFDALHMLGVVRFQQGEFVQALSLLDRALAVMPGSTAAQYNRRLVAQGLQRRVMDDELARAVLPSFARFARATLSRNDETVHAVIATARASAADVETAALAARAIGGGRCEIWHEAQPPLVHWGDGDTDVLSDVREIDATRSAFPADGNVVVVGVARSLASWWAWCRPSQVLLVVDRLAPGDLAERLRELSDQGARPVALAYTTTEVARRMPLPGFVLDRGR